MSFQRNSHELKNEILKKCGELQDGTSPFDDAATGYLNSVYQDVLSGGSEFGIEIAENWVWAESRPMPITLHSALVTNVTLTKGSSTALLSSAVSFSLKGRYLQINNVGDFYLVAQHTAGSTTIQIDQGYLNSTGTSQGTFFALDYDLVDQMIIIDSANNKIDFTEDGSVVLTASIPDGVYTPTDLCAMVGSVMTSAGSKSYTCAFDTTTRMFTLVQGGTLFSLLFATGPNAATSASLPLGFDIEDQTGSITYVSAYANSGILRLTKPITIYRDSTSYFNSNKDSGKIFHVDQNTFLRQYPLNRMAQEVPDKFCLIRQSPTGLSRARFNASIVDGPIRAEVNYIGIQRKLVDNTVSVPIVPGSYSDFLIYGASTLLMADKNDSKAADFKSLASAKLQAMVNDNRKTTQAAGNNFGRLIPRSTAPTRGPGYGY